MVAQWRGTTVSKDLGSNLAKDKRNFSFILYLTDIGLPRKKRLTLKLIKTLCEASPTHTIYSVCSHKGLQIKGSKLCNSKLVKRKYKCWFGVTKGRETGGR
jgi:hypothetical protein